MSVFALQTNRILAAPPGDDVDTVLPLSGTLVPNEVGITPGGPKQICAELFELVLLGVHELPFNRIRGVGIER